MERPNVPIGRRTALKGIGAAALAGGSGAFFATRGAAATLAFTANDPPTRVFDDGQVSAVTVEVTGATLTWDGLDHKATDADITLSAQHPDEGWEEAASNNIELTNRANGSATFDIGPVDLTEVTSFTDEDFSKDEDGETKTTAVPLRLDVVVNTEDENYTVSAQAGDTLDVSAENQMKTTGGTAASDTPTTYSGDVFDSDDNDTGDDDHLRVYYGADTIIYELDLDDFIAGCDGDVTVAGSGDPANAALGFDLDEDNVADFQLAWMPHDASTPLFGFKEADASGWDSSWTDVAGMGLIDAELNGDTVRFTIDRSGPAGLDIPEAGETYRVGAFASAGGEGPYMAVSNEPGSFWSSANNYTSSEYFLQTVAE